MDRLLRWLSEPVKPPRWIARDHDPFDDVDWATFGRTIGGRIRALDDDRPDPEIARRWKEAGKRKLPLPIAPRWHWIGLCLIILLTGVVVFGGLFLLGSHSN